MGLYPPVSYVPPSIASTPVPNSANPAVPTIGTFQLVLTDSQPVNVDLTKYVMQNGLGNIRAVFADNSVGTETLYISGVAANVAVPAGWQAFIPVFVTSPAIIQCLGRGAVTLCPLNFNPGMAIWPGLEGNAQSFFGSNSASKKKHIGAAVNSTYPAALIALSDTTLIATTFDTNSYPFMSSLYVDCSQLLATTPGWARMKIVNGSSVLLSRTFYIESSTTAANCRSVAQFENLEIVGALGAGGSGQSLLGIQFQAITAAGFSGQVEYTAFAGVDQQPF